MSELRLQEPLSFWGGLDPDTGRIIEKGHPQFGESIAGRDLFLPRSRGSTSSPAVLVEAIRRGNGPAKIIIGEPDMVVIGATFVAEQLYNVSVPVVIDAAAATS